MESKRQTYMAVLALIFPLIVLGGLWGKAITARHIGEEIWQIKMAGYDPRDILYGHYLRFRYDWNIGEEDKKRAGYRDKKQGCLCLNSGEDGTRNPVAKPMQCGAKEAESCGSLIKTYRYGSNYSLTSGSAQEKYFIPEERAKEIDKLFRDGEHDFYMELMAHKNGRTSVRGLYVGDEKLEDYLRRTATSRKDD